MPSRTSVVPVNPRLLPQTAEEVERCARTVYVANLDASASDDELEAFFRDAAGAVLRLVTHVNPRNGSRIAFVEFETAEGARAALQCAGRVFGSRALRVGPSKTPLRVAGAEAGAESAEGAAAGSAAAVEPSDQPSSSRRGRRRGPRGNTDVGAEVGRIEPPEDRDLTMWHSVHVRGVATSVSESTLARIFAGCGRVIDCRLSGWDRSRYRFAFVAFTSEGEVERALGLDGLVLEGSEIRVQRSKTAIIPVNPDFLPRSEAELERCRRTVYVANVCPDLTEADVRDTFEKMCGPISGIHLQMSTRKNAQVAFVEFADAGSAETATRHSGLRVGTRVVRVTPSKTPLRSRRESDGGGAESEIAEAKSDEALDDKPDPDPDSDPAGEDDAAALAVGRTYAAAAEETASATAKLSSQRRRSDGDGEEHETRRRVTRREDAPARRSPREAEEREKSRGEGECGTRIESPRPLARARTRSAGAPEGDARRPRSRPHRILMVMTPSEMTRVVLQIDGWTAPMTFSFISTSARFISARRVTTPLQCARPTTHAHRTGAPSSVRVRFVHLLFGCAFDVRYQFSRCGLSSPRSGRTPPPAAAAPSIHTSSFLAPVTARRPPRRASPRATHPRLHHEVSGSIPGCDDANADDGRRTSRTAGRPSEPLVR